MLTYIKRQIEQSTSVKLEILKSEEIMNLIQSVSTEAIKAYQRGNKILFAGNGGSAADAQHLAGELVSRFYFDRPGLASLALTTDTSILTAVGNDYGYESVFARQIQANAESGDIFIGISTSGNSANVLRAMEVCKQKDVITVGLTGATGGEAEGSL